ncbi:SpoIIE family protein phosphatase [Streptomyces sp. MI02-2A]|uniref:SpoIIE family protein phosphatase n=1 Tax=unclassified Streptomyces TaxID=2593676 RepID=UPI000E24966A|nr:MULTISPECIES: SpoIIE family protein phosphatase [unclassified Streptomyces]MDX3265863.1 SpoIIE family protein phosphatase [Streptomyces sp. MI02-2A]REE63999.1 PAS domain S-box-containing protein [Streptomyces sp. 3212.3]
MGSSAATAVSKASRAFETVGPAIALLDAQGTVVGWSQAAQRLVGYSAAEVVGRSAGALLVAADDRAKASHAAQESTLRGRWSGLAQVRHRDGRGIDVRLCVSSLSGQDGREWWVVWATDKASLPPWPAEATMAEPLLATLPLPSRLPIGVVIRDTHLRCIRVNDTQGSKDGIPLPQRLGRRLTEAAPGTEAETLEAVMHQVLESGDPAINVDYQAFLPANVRSNRILTASFFRLDDAQGRALGVCAVSVDVTDSRRARERLAILGEASRRIGTTLDVMQTGQELADLAVPFLADYATVDLAETVPLGEEPLAHLGPQDGHIPAFRRAGLASIHPGTPESLFARGEPVFVPPISPFTNVLRSGKSHFEPILDTSPGTWLDHQDAARAQKIRKYAMHSLMVVPIHARGAVLGVAVFVRTKDSRPFEQDDLLLAEELVSWAALALDNARQYVRERSAALALQRLLLPHHATGGSAAEVAWRYLPADSHHGIGGDWFDVIPLSGARVALVVGDVVGHGINAAAKMGQLRTAMRTLADMDMPPDEVLSRLDEQVIRLTEAEADPRHPATTTMAATCLYAVYDPITRTCTMARAGHPPPAVIDPHGHVTFPDLPTGAPLGLGLGPFESTTLELAEGSVLALYTDGLIEARDQDINAGMNRLRAALAQPHLTLDDLCSSTVDTLRAKPPSDDVTLLLARTRSLSADQVASWQFPSDPAVVGRARTVAIRQLTQWGLEHLAESTELIVSELVTNAIIHGNGDRTIGLRLIRHEMLTCEVSDAGHSHPLVRRPRTTDEHGRGLFLVTQLSRRWGTRHIPDGKLIWADQQLPASA